MLLRLRLALLGRTLPRFRFRTPSFSLSYFRPYVFHSCAFGFLDIALILSSFGFHFAPARLYTCARSRTQQEEEREGGTARTAQREQDKHNRTGITRQAENWKSRTGQTEKDCQDRTARKGGKHCQDMAANTELPGQVFPDRTARRGQPGQDCKHKTARAIIIASRHSAE